MENTPYHPSLQIIYFSVFIAFSCSCPGIIIISIIIIIIDIIISIINIILIIIIIIIMGSM